MAFFENFYQPLGAVPASIMDPLRERVSSLPADSPIVRGRSDETLAEGTYVPIFYQGRPLNKAWCEHTASLVEYVCDLGLACIKGWSLFKTELSIVPPGGSLKWHHDIYLKDKITERIHVPVITNPETVFLAKWFTDESIYAFKMAQDGIYRLNNRVPHMVRNGGTVTRYHLMLNFARKDVMDYLLAHPAHMEAVDPNGPGQERRAVSAVTPRDETYYYVNHAPAGVYRIEQTFPHPPLSAQRLERLLTGLNTVRDM